jgi:hypothetical protein
MGLRFRRRVAFGPLRINISKRGVRSVSTVLGPLTINSNGTKTLRLGNGFSWTWGGKT